MFVRSPELMLPEESALLIVDVQEKLLPVVKEADQLLFNIRRFRQILSGSLRA